MKRFLLISGLFHFAVLFFMIFFKQYFSSFFPNKMVRVNSQEFVKVDLVGMPDQTLEELKKMQAVEVPSKKVEIEEKKAEEVKEEKIEPKKDEKVVELKTKVKKTEEKKTPKKKKKIVKTVKAEKATAAKKEKSIDNESLDNLSELVLMGNQISKGQSVDSNKITKEDINNMLDLYASKVKSQVKNYWKLPAHLLDSDYSAEVKISIDKDGFLDDFEFIKKSENEEYNEIVKEVLKRSAPFPKPDPEIITELKQGILVIAFPF